MGTRIDYTQIAQKLDYAALEKKLNQLGERTPPKTHKTAGDILEPLRERLMALHRKGWSSGQLVEELKAAGVPVSPAKLRECLNLWSGNGNGAAKKRTRRPQKKSAPVHPATTATASPARSRISRDDHQPGLKLS